MPAPRVEDSRRALVFGAGAVGGYLGARLQTASPPWEVTLLARPTVVEAIRQDGVRVTGQGTNIHVHPAAVSSVDGMADVRLLLLTVRSDDVAASVGALATLLSEDGVLLAVQNGVGTEDVLAGTLGRDRVIAVALTTSVVVARPGVIERTGRADGIAIAGYDGPPPEWLHRALESTGMAVTVIRDVRALRWSKLLLNMIGAPTSAVLDMDIGAIVSDPHLFRIEQLAFREATRVMGATGVEAVDLPGYPVRLARLAMRLPRPLAQRLLATRIASARSGRSPGMRADLQRNRSEIDSFHGAIARAGAAVGVRTPVCTALTDLMHDLLASPDHRQEYVGNPEALVSFLTSRGVRV